MPSPLSLQVQRKILETENPDLIVFGGDMVSGRKAKGRDEGGSEGEKDGVRVRER